VLRKRNTLHTITPFLNWDAVTHRCCAPLFIRTVATWSLLYFPVICYNKHAKRLPTRRRWAASGLVCRTWDAQWSWSGSGSWGDSIPSSAFCCWSCCCPLCFWTGEEAYTVVITPINVASYRASLTPTPKMCSLIHRSYIVFYFDRYIHIMMVFWSFLAGVVTFYCSLGPESLLPNVLGSIKPKNKVPLNAIIAE